MGVPRLPDIVHPVAALPAAAAPLGVSHHKLDVSQHAGKLPPHVGHHVQGRVAQEVAARIIVGRSATALRHRGQGCLQRLLLAEMRLIWKPPCKYLVSSAASVAEHPEQFSTFKHLGGRCMLAAWLSLGT